MNWESLYKIGAASSGVVVGYLFGGWSVLLQVLLTFVAIDYVTGLLASGVQGKLSSKVGFKGIAKKLTIFCLIAVGHLVDKTIGQGHLIGDAVVFFYLGNELLSILENAGRAGLKIPTVLKNAVEILQGKGEGK